MNENIAAANKRFRGSTRAQRIGAAALASFVIAYLAIITYFMSDDLTSTKRIVVFAFLWLIGIGALFLLSRAWRRGKVTNENS